jgi:hypothetical protein
MYSITGPHTNPKTADPVRRRGLNFATVLSRWVGIVPWARFTWECESSNKSSFEYPPFGEVNQIRSTINFVIYSSIAIIVQTGNPKNATSSRQLTKSLLNNRRVVSDSWSSFHVGLSRVKFSFLSLFSLTASNPIQNTLCHNEQTGLQACDPQEVNLFVMARRSYV